MAQMEQRARKRRVVAAKIKVNDEVNWDGYWWICTEVEGEGLIHLTLQRGPHEFKLTSFQTRVFQIIRREN